MHTSISGGETIQSLVLVSLCAAPRAEGVLLGPSLQQQPALTSPASVYLTYRDPRRLAAQVRFLMSPKAGLPDEALPAL